MILIGADAVGMSNAHECLVARHVNMKVLSIALITNKVRFVMFVLTKLLLLLSSVAKASLSI